MNKNLHNSVLYIDMGQLRRNAEAILRELDGAQLIPVLKGNAYGLGLEKVGAALADIPEIRTMAVAQVSEGAALRQAGVTQDILVLGGVPERLLAPAVELGLTLTVGRPGLLPLLAELGRTQGRPVQVQVKVETGLHRFGLMPGEELDGLLEEWREYAPWIRVTGAFTHFADLGDPVRTEEQFQTYLRGVAQLERGGMEIPMRHVSASAASEYAPQYRLDGVRIGRRLYMDHPTAPLGTVREVCSWRAWVTRVRPLRAGDALGYGGHIRMPRMDQTVVDVTGIPCAVDDEVTLLGGDGHGNWLSAQEVSLLIGEDEGCGLTSRLSGRVGRVYL